MKKKLILTEDKIDWQHGGIRTRFWMNGKIFIYTRNMTNADNSLRWWEYAADDGQMVRIYPEDSKWYQRATRSKVN